MCSRSLPIHRTDSTFLSALLFSNTARFGETRVMNHSRQHILHRSENEQIVFFVAVYSAFCCCLFVLFCVCLFGFVWVFCPLEFVGE